MNFGGGSSKQDTSFQRIGTQSNAMKHDLPSFLSNLMTNAANSAKVDPNLATRQSTFYQDLLGANPRTMPGYNTFLDNSRIDPSDFTGAANLRTMAQRDPYSSAYEQNTEDAYKQRAADAMSQVATGPEAVRGGVARTGIAQGVLADRLSQGRGQEVRQAQMQDAALVQQAIQAYNGIEGGRRNERLQGGAGLAQLDQSRRSAGLEAGGAVDRQRATNAGVLQSTAESMGTKIGSTTDDMHGKGMQTQNSFNWGANLLGGCCFIFLQGLNGNLPWYIEFARRDYYTPTRKRGYKWMSSWLIPIMRRSRLAKRTVNTSLIRPFLRYGAWLYGADGGKLGWAWAPYCQAWLGVWGTIGRFIKEK